MINIKGQVDHNDLAYITARFGAPLMGMPCPMKQGKVNPQASTFYYGNGKYVSVFHVKPIYYETIDGKWRPLSEVTSYHGNKRLDLLSGWEEKMSLPYLRWLLQRMELINGKVSIPYPLIGLKHIREGQEIFLTTSTFYPDPSPETTSVDGYSQRSSDPSTWASIRGGAGTDAADSDALYDIPGLYASATSNQWAAIVRAFYLFDTSSLPDTDIISSATLSLYGETGSTNNFSQSVVIDSSLPASNTAIVAGDYASVGGVEQASNRIAISAWAVGYNDFTLNATGIGNISKTGISKFAARLSGDFDNSEPTWSNNFANTRTRQAEDIAGTKDPKLVVVHTVPTGGVSLLSLMGVGS